MVYVWGDKGPHPFHVSMDGELLWCSTFSAPRRTQHPQLLWVQQGDPLGPLGFALTLQPIAERIREEVPGLKINAWYFDDRTLCGSACDLVKALKIIEEDGPARGLHLNRSKSLLHISEDVDLTNNPLPSDIPISRVSFNLLDSPIGPPSFCEAMVLKRVEKVKVILSRLADLQDSQMETTLLRSCPPNHNKQAAGVL